MGDQGGLRASELTETIGFSVTATIAHMHAWAMSGRRKAGSTHGGNLRGNGRP